MVYKPIHNKLNAKGNIFVAAFTTAWARLHLYSAVEQLGERVLYMDTDSVIFTHRPGEWEPELNSFLGGWTSEIKPGQEILEFNSCGPKNYSYTVSDCNSARLKEYKKVKGLHFTRHVDKLIKSEDMFNQVMQYGEKCPWDCSNEKQYGKRRRCLFNNIK